MKPDFIENLLHDLDWITESTFSKIKSCYIGHKSGVPVFRNLPGYHRMILNKLGINPAYEMSDG